MSNYLYNLATDKYKGPAASLLKLCLLALSGIYGVCVRIVMYVCRLRQYRAQCKVISVGNITLGGTGKTPLVEYIARRLKERGCKTAVLTRGYRPKGAGGLADEPGMLRQRLKDIPVVVEAHRIRGIESCVRNFGADTVILDDGFQQWKIRKDVEIVVIDAVNPFGNRHMIPRGMLRQPLASLKYADVFVLTKTDSNPRIIEIKNFLSRSNPQAVIVEAMHTPVSLYVLGKSEDVLDIHMLKGVTVTLLSGIGDPDYFENTARGLGAEVGLSFRFPDHYQYSPSDVDAIVGQSKSKNITTIVTTEKDAVRLRCCGDRQDFTPVRFLVLRIELTITKDEQRFLSRL